MFITGQLLNTIFRIGSDSELFMTPEQRVARSGRRKERRPLYKAIYSFIFGDGDPDAGWDTVEKKAFVAFAQANKDIVTMPEFMALTGLGPLQAEERINRFLYEFEGSPEVTDGGGIYYFFPSPCGEGTRPTVLSARPSPCGASLPSPPTTRRRTRRSASSTRSICCSAPIFSTAPCRCRPWKF